MSQVIEKRREQFIERPLPSSEEAERVILGAIVLDNKLISQTIEGLRADDFYSPLYRCIYSAMLKLFERGSRIDPILIGEELKRDGSLESIGGVTTISNLTYGIPHFSDLSEYIKIVRGKSIVRDIVRAASSIASYALEESETVETVIHYAESTIFNVCTIEAKSSPETIGALALASVEKTARLKASGVKFTGLTSGFADIDEKTGGWKKNDLIIVAARPSMGKSSLMLCFCQNGAGDENSVILIFSLEMSKEQLTARLICSEAKIDLHRYINGYLTGDELLRAANAAEKLQKLKIIIDDTPGISPVEMRAKAQRIYAEHKRLDLIVADYLQLMTSSKRSESRQQEVSQISRELKAVAKELDVPVIALSQLSRAPEARNPPRPLMSDLRESGSIEQDADVVCFIYREDYYKPLEENAGVAEFIIAKQRNGPTGTVKLAFLKEYTRFENYYAEYTPLTPIAQMRNVNPRNWVDADEDRFK